MLTGLLQVLTLDEKQPFTESAADMYFTDDPVYKNWDYRCLAPDSHSDPQKWGSYNMTVFRNWTGEENDYPQDWIVKYDDTFNNWINPEVLQEFVYRGVGQWAHTYGFYTTTDIRWHFNRGIQIDSTKEEGNCEKRCDKLVRIGK